MGKLAAHHGSAQPGDTEYRKNLYAAAIYGDTLLHLARSSAIEKHLKTVESLLSDLRQDKSDDAKLEEMTEEDSDLRSVQPSAIHDGEVVPLWESYLHWLRLMVVYFDAVSTLILYIQRPGFQHNGVAIKILTPPRVSKEMFSWTRLLESKHFPTMLLSGISTAEIAKFLNTWSSSDEKGKDNSVEIDGVLKAFRELLDSNPRFDSTMATQPITGQLRRLKDSRSPGWEECVKNLILKTESLNNMTERSGVRVIRDIIQKLETMRDSSILFKEIQKDALSIGILPVRYTPSSSLPASSIYHIVLVVQTTTSTRVYWMNYG